jgi:hypothetical protein
MIAAQVRTGISPKMTGSRGQEPVCFRSAFLPTCDANDHDCAQEDVLTA